MLLQRENDYTDTSYYSHVPTAADKAEYTEQPTFTLLVGSHQDSGIRRQHKPNEDTIFIMNSARPSASPLDPPKAFVLLGVADGMGGQGHGQEASRLATRCLVEYISGFPY